MLAKYAASQLVSGASSLAIGDGAKPPSRTSRADVSYGEPSHPATRAHAQTPMRVATAKGTMPAAPAAGREAESAMPWHRWGTIEGRTVVLVEGVDSPRLKVRPYHAWAAPDASVG
jgi:hypothetical protein